MKIYTKYLKNTLETYNNNHYDQSGIYKVVYTDNDVNNKNEYVIVFKNLQLVMGIGVEDYIDKENMEKDILEICKVFEESKIKDYENKLKEKEQEIIKLKEEYNKKEKEYIETINDLKTRNEQLQEESIKMLEQIKNSISSDILLKTIAVSRINDDDKLIKFLKEE